MKHKYHAKPYEYKGRKYPSTAQAERAMYLDGRVEAGYVGWYLEEVKFPLGPDFSYRVDFLVFAVCSEMENCMFVVAEDVKGMETPRFRTVRKLWKKYGPCPLHVLKKGKVEIVEGAQG
jgi:hypothetical protein